VSVAEVLPQEPPPKSTAELFIELTKPLFPPMLTDLRRRCAEAAKAKGASKDVVEAVLGVVLEVGK
jgi:hypothetical protein